MLAKIKNHKLFLVFSLGYFCFSLLTYKDYGITSDEELNYRAGKTYIKYLFSNITERADFIQNASPKDNPETFPHFRLYPGIVSLLNYNSYYEWAHLINLSFGYIGFLIIYLFVYKITGSCLSIFAPILMFLNPHYFGHIPANPKDIPFATIYLSCLFLILNYDLTKKRVVFLLGLLLAITIGIRLVGATLLAVLFVKAIKNPKHILPSISIICLATLVLYVIWPFLWHDTLDKVRVLILGAQDFLFWDRRILFEGKMIVKDERPWYYLIRYIAIKTPVLILVGFIGSIFIRSNKTRYIWLMVMVNIFLYLVLEPTTYNEMRHFLYLIPLLIALAAVCFVKLLNSTNATISKTTFILVSLCLSKMLYDFVLLHPYQYVYFNEFTGGVSKASQNYEYDYWSASYKESVEYLRYMAQSSGMRYKVYTCNLAFGVEYYSHKSFELVNKSAEADYYICDYMNSLKRHFDLKYNIVYEVKRKGATLSYVAKTAK